jgi:hypothetical protein
MLKRILLVLLLVVFAMPGILLKALRLFDRDHHRGFDHHREDSHRSDRHEHDHRGRRL